MKSMASLALTGDDSEAARRAISSAVLRVSANASGRFECPVAGCDASFSHKTNLRRHMLSHTPVRPHVCDICKRAFHRPDDLASHRRSHTLAASPAAPVGVDARKRRRVQPLAAHAIGSVAPGQTHGARGEPSACERSPVSLSEALARVQESAQAMARAHPDIPFSSVEAALAAARDTMEAFELRVRQREHRLSMCESDGAESSAAPHVHGVGCGHAPVLVGRNVSFLLPDGRLDVPGLSEPVALPAVPTGSDACDPVPSTCTHVHSHGCGHVRVRHGDHVDFLVDGRLHHWHAGHCDDHGSVRLLDDDVLTLLGGLEEMHASVPGWT